MMQAVPQVCCAHSGLLPRSRNDTGDMAYPCAFYSPQTDGMFRSKKEPFVNHVSDTLEYCDTVHYIFPKETRHPHTHIQKLKESEKTGIDIH